MVSQVRLNRWKQQIRQHHGVASHSTLDAIKKYLHAEPDDEEVLAIAGYLYSSIHKFKIAEDIYSKLVSTYYHEDYVMAWIRSLYYLGNYIKVKELISTFFSEIKTPENKLKLAHLCSLNKDLDSALLLYKSLLSDPKHYEASRLGCGSVNQSLGDLDKAKHFFSEVVKRNPNNSQALFNLTRIRKATDDENTISQIKALLSEAIPDSDRVKVCYALGKEYEDLKQYSDSFESYTLGAEIMKSNHPYDFNIDQAVVNLMRTICSMKGVSATAKAKSPIFILGAPRTGSTLVERILSSHSMVESYGETEALRGSICQTLKLSETDETSLQQFIQAGLSIDYQAVADGYYDNLVNDSDHKYFVEKTPRNIFYLGLILNAFPNAKIIYPQRSAMDVCLSNFKQLFAPGSYVFSYDLKDIADYYCLVERELDYWSERYSNQIFRVSYENLVSDSDDEIKKLLDFVDLPFESQCLVPEKNPMVSITASSAQIRQPINSDSMAKWLSFDEHMGKAKQALIRNGLPKNRW